MLSVSPFFPAFFAEVLACLTGDAGAVLLEAEDMDDCERNDEQKQVN